MGSGPILIFDKSALQSLTVDESVMLDQFFLTNVTPIFFIETLADLEKIDPKGRPSEDVVRNLAEKTPDDTMPNVFHQTLLVSDLLGYAVGMTGQIQLAGGVAKPDGRGGMSVVFDEPPEAEMVRRWYAGEFREIERLHARRWRAALSGIDFVSRIEMCRRLIPFGERIATLDAARDFANAFVSRAGREVMTFAVEFLDIPHEHVGSIERRYTGLGRPRFNEFAPYAAFVLSIDLTFYLGMGISQIGADRRTNVMDLSYLYYLPFCMVFTSGDKLHRRLAPMFMRPRQRFVKAEELKTGLRALNEHYAQMRDEVDKVGLMRLAHEPPRSVQGLILELWDHCLLRLDGSDEPQDEQDEPDESSEALLERIKSIDESTERVQMNPGMQQPDSVIVHSRRSRRRGSWQVLPPDV